MKKINKLIPFILASGIVSFNSMADTDSTWQAVKHNTKAVGYDVSSKIDEGKAKINEKLNDPSAVTENKEKALKNKLSSDKEKLTADAYKIKGKAIDEKEGTTSDKIKEKTSTTWEKVKDKTSEGWSKTKSATEEEYKKATE